MDLLGALVSLDALVCARITLMMVDYRLDVPISAQPDRDCTNSSTSCTTPAARTGKKRAG